MITLEGDKTSLFQWDLNQRVIIDDLTIEQVHFSNDGIKAYVREVYEQDGIRYANIPNTLLTRAERIMVYTYDSDDTETVEKGKIKVVARAKPEDYVYTEEEKLFYKTLEEKVDSIDLPTKLSDLDNDLYAVKEELLVDITLDDFEELVVEDEMSRRNEYISYNKSPKISGISNFDELEFEIHIKRTDLITNESFEENINTRENTNYKLLFNCLDKKYKECFTINSDFMKFANGVLSDDGYSVHDVINSFGCKLLTKYIYNDTVFKNYEYESVSFKLWRKTYTKIDQHFIDFGDIAKIVNVKIDSIIDPETNESVYFSNYYHEELMLKHNKGYILFLEQWRTFGIFDAGCVIFGNNPQFRIYDSSVEYVTFPSAEIFNRVIITATDESTFECYGRNSFDTFSSCLGTGYSNHAEIMLWVKGSNIFGLENGAYYYGTVVYSKHSSPGYYDILQYLFIDINLYTEAEGHRILTLKVDKDGIYFEKMTNLEVA